MAGVSDFVVFAPSATSPTSLPTQSDYVNDVASIRINGVAIGVANPLYANKAWRQSTIMSTVIGQFIVDKATGSVNATDDGTTATLLANFKSAVANTLPAGVTSVAASGGTTGLSFTGGPITTTGTLTLTGTLAVANGGTGLTGLGAANQVLTTNSAGTAAVWANPTTGSASVSSVQISGGATGLTVSGGPITTSGTITLAGTVAISAGGTGQTTANAALNVLLPTQTSNSGKYLTTNATNTSWATIDVTPPFCDAPTGASNIYNCTNTPPITTRTHGMCVSFIAHQTNTGNCTYNPDGLGAHAIWYGGYQLTGNEIIIGRMHRICWDSNNLRWVLHTENLATPGTASDIWIGGVYANGFTNRNCNMGHFAHSNQSTSTSQGYYKLPNGMIHMWATGSVTSGSDYITINWPLTFPNGVLQSWADDSSPNGTWNSNNAFVAAVDKATMTTTQARLYRRQITTSGPTLTTPSTFQSMVHAIGF